MNKEIKCTIIDETDDFSLLRFESPKDAEPDFLHSYYVLAKRHLGSPSVNSYGTEAEAREHMKALRMRNQD